MYSRYSLAYIIWVRYIKFQNVAIIALQTSLNVHEILSSFIGLRAGAFSSASQISSIRIKDSNKHGPNYDNNNDNNNDNNYDNNNDNNYDNNTDNNYDNNNDNNYDNNNDNNYDNNNDNNYDNNNDNNNDNTLYLVTAIDFLILKSLAKLFS